MEHWRYNPETDAADQGNVWDLARREYLSGMRAIDICRRYGMSLRSFRLRARVEKWRRIDRLDCDVEPEDGEYHPDDDVGFADLADQVFLNIRRAIGARRAAEAASWMRLFDKLALRAQGEVMSELPDFPPPLEPEPEPEREPLRLTIVDVPESLNDSRPMEPEPQDACEALHLLHPVFSECKAGSETEPAPERATPPEPAPGADQAASAAAIPASEALKDIHRKALLLLRSRRLEHGIGVTDVDEQLAELGPGP
ncbi:MAG: hypothetical protein EBR82_15165 [Caulobacteraceae bacterium]|nr:hypothetical protein [Caulobacteraceae bacterium]